MIVHKDIVLSMIVPCYNIDVYLAKCLDSLLDQDLTLDSYEIIIINDGSTDNSLAIAESYALRYKHIKVLSQSNKGLGAARNTGIKASIGKYLLFVDSDDYIQAKSLTLVLSKMEEDKLDVLRFNYLPVNEAGIILPKKKNSLHSIVWDDKVTTGRYFLSNKLGWACYVWAYVFKAELIKESELYFNEDIYFEDVEWLIRVLLKTNRIATYDSVIYYYLQRIGSITASVDKKKQEKIYRDKLFILEFLTAIATKKSVSEEVRKWCKGMVSLTIIGLLTYVQKQLPEKKEAILVILKDKKYLPLSMYRFTWKQKRDIAIINCSPKLFLIMKKVSMQLKNSK